MQAGRQDRRRQRRNLGLALTCFAALLLAVPPTSADNHEDDDATPSDQISERDRVWWNFNRETAVVGSGKLRLEVRGEAINKSSDDAQLDLTGFPVDDLEQIIRIRQGLPPIDPTIPPESEDFIDSTRVKSVDGGRFDLRAAYGLGSTAEIGFDLPFFTQNIKFRDPMAAMGETQFNTPTISNEGVGDLVLYGKFRRMLSSSTSIGAGLEIWTPTGHESKRLGTGELGFNPFVNIRHDWKRFAVGAHVGYLMYRSDFVDVINYSTYFLARGSERLGFRLELSGRHLRAFGEKLDDLSVLPGLDFALAERVTLRPQGRAHLTNEAWEWGIGLGIVVDIL